MVLVNEDIELDDGEMVVGVPKVHVLTIEAYPIDQPM
jgi:hypothetical protein